MKNGWVDFRLIKQSVTIQMVLDHYGVNGLRKNGDELRGRCPIHKGDGGPTFQVNVSKNVFQCFSCKARGNVLDLVAAIDSCTVREAALKLKDCFGVGKSERPNVRAGNSGSQQVSAGELVESTAGRQAFETISDARLVEEAPKVINPPLGFRLMVNTEHEYGLGRGLTKETLDFFGAGFCRSKGTFAGRFIIPLHNETGEMVGYAGRSVDDSEPKYLFPSSSKGFYKSHLVYNLHRVLSLCVDTVVVVEGFFSVMWLHQAGLPAAVGLLGSELSAEQEGILCRHFERIVLLFDGDAAGQDCIDQCLARLGRQVWVRTITLSGGLQPDGIAVEELRSLVNQCLIFS
jgi:DNA primase